nr:TPA_asm: M26 uoORF [Murid betaherpesvirus 1]DBA07949.1 TPA_asm: M26 uoORF [Murid betaherpesvirus 1]
MASEAVAVAGGSKGMELRTQLRLDLIEADSPTARPRTRSASWSSPPPWVANA